MLEGTKLLAENLAVCLRKYKTVPGLDFFLILG